MSKSSWSKNTSTQTQIKRKASHNISTLKPVIVDVPFIDTTGWNIVNFIKEYVEAHPALLLHHLLNTNTNNFIDPRREIH